MDDRLRRLHAISGVMPLGVFVVVHILVNATALSGPIRYDRVVGGLARLPMAWLFEVLFVGVPLAFHAGSGLARLRQEKKKKPLDVLQRVASVLLLVFVVAHAWETRFAGGGREIVDIQTRLMMHLSTTTGMIPLIALGYIVGLAVTCFHLGYGCWTVLETSGRASRRVARWTIAGTTLLFVVGLATILGLATGGTLVPDVDPASAIPCPSR